MRNLFGGRVWADVVVLVIERELLVSSRFELLDWKALLEQKLLDVDWLTRLDGALATTNES